MITLPKWPTENEEERKQVLAWACDHLEQRIAAPNRADVRAKQREWLLSDEPALESARNGDYERLRRRYPDLAPHLNPPPLGKGQHKPSTPGVRPGDGGAKLIPIVQEIWREYYGKRNKAVGYGPSALEIAAYFAGTSAPAVEGKRKNAGRTSGKSLLRR